MRCFGYIIFDLQNRCIFLQVLADLNHEWPQSQQEAHGWWKEKTSLRTGLTGLGALTTFSILATQSVVPRPAVSAAPGN